MKKVINIFPNIKTDPFIEEPHVIHVTKFDTSGLKDFREDFNKCLASKQEIIPVYIDSPGGVIYSLLGMLDLIASSPVPVATFCGSKAMSCGAVLLTAGTPGYRFASPNSYVLIHEASNMCWGKMTDLENDTMHGLELNKKLMNMLDKNCGKPKGYFQQLLLMNGNADLYFDAKSAKKHGIIDKIGYAELQVDVTQTVSLCVK